MNKSEKTSAKGLLVGVVILYFILACCLLGSGLATI